MISMGVVFRAFALQSVDVGSIVLSSHTKDFNLMFTAFQRSLLEAQHKRDSVGNKQARLPI